LNKGLLDAYPRVTWIFRLL